MSDDLVRRLLAVIPRLERPVVWLEDGANRGRVLLAWGARTRYRVPWGAGADGVDSLRAAAAGSRLYGVLAYDLGLPPRAARRRPPVAQPLVDLFAPRHELIIDVPRNAIVTGVMPDGTDSADPAGPTDPLVIPSSGDAVASSRHPVSLLSRSFDQPGFESAVRRIKDHIAAGDVYQINLALAECFAVGAAPWAVYRRVRAINPSPWMGYADFGDWQIVSGSPELLVEVGGQEGHDVRVVRTRPIAGTRKKTGDAARDAAMRAELVLDPKEQAEHRMLVDLARNDVGRVATFGSVRVAAREEVEEYSHVFHLVSEVVGTLRADLGPWDAVAALFPGGTITGAPKIRAMELIADLEHVARGAYTGGLGWIGPEGTQLNILIRSAVFRDGVACVQAGAGIVWDSDPAREWRESLRKGSAMRLALGCAE